MRVGVLSLLHESNTFLPAPTEIERFAENLLVEGPAVAAAYEGAHHEVAGVLDSLRRAKLTAVPLFAARATPSGAITTKAWQELTQRLQTTLREAGPLDGVVCCPHGATVSEPAPDADGEWLTLVRSIIGLETPLVATIDPHANVSQKMIDACDAMVAYHTNPHLDQRARGQEAGQWMAEILAGRLRPTMAVAFPPIAINIERQCTDEEPCKSLFRQAEDAARAAPGGVSCSVVLGFPYSDVAEMGSSVIAVTNDRPQEAIDLAAGVAEELWRLRREFTPTLIEVDDALARAATMAKPVCLLDMGDNVGGGSPADGTWLAHGLLRQNRVHGFICLNDPAAVEMCRGHKLGDEFDLVFAGKLAPEAHGPPISARVKLTYCGPGVFREDQPRHGGYGGFDQGPTAVVQAGPHLTVMLTSVRTPPFSLQQFAVAGLDPRAFDVLVAKGVNAPLAAYREVCPSVLRVNTMGSTTADMERLTYHHRRRPLFPWEECEWTPTATLSATARRRR